MACVVLPSETARLVYGYLVKEKLDNIALQFLENSPYLTDCCHIVKSGFHFNTKFLYKELHELIQEYSTIQNLVNKKIGLLSKTSLLYKRIKLQCESLPEILDLILFWRYHINKTDSSGSSSNDDKTRKTTKQTENKTDEKEATINNNTGNVSNLSVQVQDSECSELIPDVMQKDIKIMGESEAEVYDDTGQKLSSEFSVDISGSNAKEPASECLVESARDENRIANSDDPAKYSVGEDQTEVCEMSKENGGMNVSMGNLNGGCVDKGNKLQMPSLPSEPDLVSIDSQIKIVRIEKDAQESQDKNHLTNSFSQSLSGMETGMNMENGSVLYVTPDVGKVTINQDRNQIIVIPIDYYKSQGSQNDVDGVSQSIQMQDIMDGGGAEKCNIANNGIIFEDVTPAITSLPATTATVASMPFTSSAGKKPSFDDTIVTERTFLQNKELIFELDSKIKPQLFQGIAPLRDGLPAVVPSPAPPPPQPQPQPVHAIIVSQVIEKPEPHYRRILPRTSAPVEVVVQPLIENNKVVPSSKERTKRHASPKKGSTLRKKSKAVVPAESGGTGGVAAEKVAEERDMPSIKTPVHAESIDDDKEGEKEVDAANSEKINEEKENLGTNAKKAETPVVVAGKNSKRLSLSTPRRRSHVRALEFETPTKTKSVKKKSRTSPKVRVEEVKVKNKNVRNTLFKSPDSDTIPKTPACLKPKEVTPNAESKPAEGEAPTPAPKLSDAWESLTGLGCVIGKPEKKLKSWDSDLRNFFVSSSSCSGGGNATPNDNGKKRARKPKKTPKKQTCKKSLRSTKKRKVPQGVSLTAKRNTYSISGNEEGSPVRTLLEELDLVTPFKDPEPVRPAEETPLTKLFRENINGIDIDLSMITTPVFPPTPSIVITPDIDDSSGLAGTYYYSPVKESKEKGKVEGNKNELAKTEKYAQSDSEQAKKKEAHEKEIGELVSKAKEIVRLGAEANPENVIKKPPSGKVLSMVKIQMITQCNKKLCENIPINEEEVAVVPEVKTLLENVSEELSKFDLRCELEEKRKRALDKIKAVKENLADQTKRKGKVKRAGLKRKRPGVGVGGCEATKSGKRTKRDSPNGSSIDGKASDGTDKETEIYHSTPYHDRKAQSCLSREGSAEKVDSTLLDEIRGEFPPFVDDGEFPELPVKTRKKLHFIKHFLKTEEIVRFLDERKPPRLRLKPSRKKFFQVFYKWLKHPHGREVNTSEQTKLLLLEYLAVFEKIRKGICRGEQVGDDGEEEEGGGEEGEGEEEEEEGAAEEEEEEKRKEAPQEGASRIGSQSQLSDDDGESKQKTSAKKKEDEAEDGPVSILPLKKRKATVQPLEVSETDATKPSIKSADNPSQTQNFLQDIDVDRFLSQIHGQENR